jgi:hypothetical protein
VDRDEDVATRGGDVVWGGPHAGAAENSPASRRYPHDRSTGVVRDQQAADSEREVVRLRAGRDLGGAGALIDGRLAPAALGPGSSRASSPQPDAR